MLESIDDKDFYHFARSLDGLTSDNVNKVIIEMAHKLFNKTAIDNWFNDKTVKNKLKPEERAKSESIKALLTELSSQLSLPEVAKLLRMIADLPGVACTRKEVLQCLIKALLNATGDDLSVYDAMVLVRNSIRRMGRKVKGKCLGTTLLTKGLEFDTVAILNAGKFTDPKHLYVALTRASKKLVIFNDSPILSPTY
jgi:DNA helicase-2/ATP-dependent DNA helicase PcrA